MLAPFLALATSNERRSPGESRTTLEGGAPQE